jgi:hypothetical protein
MNSAVYSRRDSAGIARRITEGFGTAASIATFRQPPVFSSAPGTDVLS